MKLHLQTGVAMIVTGTAPGVVRVNADEYRENLVLAPDRVETGFAPRGFEGLAAADFAALAARKPAVVILGTGSTHRFPHPSLLAPLYEAGIGVESMATPAACRTFNILAGEGREVLAALIVGE